MIDPFVFLCVGNFLKNRYKTNEPVGRKTSLREFIRYERTETLFIANQLQKPLAAMATFYLCWNTGSGVRIMFFHSKPPLAPAPAPGL